jgi:DNA-binding transcriptional ArsR family regulator
MARRGSHEIVIGKRAQLSALASPQRVRILELLLASAPASIKDVARQMGRPPASLYHHFALLQRAGLIVAKGTRGAGRTLEQLYAPAARAMRAKIDPNSSADRRALAKVAQAHTRFVLRRLTKAVTTDGAIEGERRTASARLVTLRLSAAQLGELNRDIEALTAKWNAATCADPSVALSVLVLTAPDPKWP